MPLPHALPVRPGDPLRGRRAAAPELDGQQVACHYAEDIKAGEISRTAATPQSAPRVSTPFERITRPSYDLKRLGEHADTRLVDAAERKEILEPLP